MAEGIKKTGESLVSFYNESAEVRKFNEETAGKLNGSIPLEEGEQIFEQVKVVPAGANFEELRKMQQEGTLVNVRNYPGTNTPSGQLSRIIGKLPQETIIEHAILVQGLRPHPTTSDNSGMNEWIGFVYKKTDADPNEPGEIGYIYRIFGEPQSAVESPPAPITPNE